MLPSPLATKRKSGHMGPIVGSDASPISKWRKTPQQPSDTNCWVHKKRNTKIENRKGMIHTYDTEYTTAVVYVVLRAQ